ncbi:hypothetical protein LCGC14_3085800, partial [marine sediment metagenome]
MAEMHQEPKRPHAAPPKEKPTIAELEAMIEDGAEPHIAPDGEVTVEHPKVHRLEDVLASPPSDAAPVAWRFRSKNQRGWNYISSKPCLGKHPDDVFETQALYAHPEDAPGFDPFKEEPPTDADEPPWKGWFSCEDCNGWFCGQPTCYESGDEVCNGCAFCRAQKDAPEIPMADQDELEDIAR